MKVVSSMLAQEPLSHSLLWEGTVTHFSLFQVGISIGISQSPDKQQHQHEVTMASLSS